MNYFKHFALILPLVASGVGCTNGPSENVDSSPQATTQAQDIAFECTCDDDACRVPGLMDLRVYYATNERSVRVQTFYGTSMLSTADTSNFVGTLAYDSGDGIVFDGFEHVSPTLTPAQPSRPQDEALVGASMRIDRALLETGPEYDGEEVPPSIHRSFGFVDVKHDGEHFSYTCEGMWREDL